MITRNFVIVRFRFQKGNMSELTEIQSFYKGKNIFVTGGTGLMGKVLIEKLLYSCSDINKIYVLIRPKRGRSPETRMDEVFKLPVSIPSLFFPISLSLSLFNSYFLLIELIEILSHDIIIYLFTYNEVKV